jgi:hypothetical protein
MGKTIVAFTWVSKCLQSSRIVPATLFEPNDIFGEPGPYRSRISFANGLGSKLFQVTLTRVRPRVRTLEPVLKNNELRRSSKFEFSQT